MTREYRSPVALIRNKQNLNDEKNINKNAKNTIKDDNNNRGEGRGGDQVPCEVVEIGSWRGDTNWRG